MLLATSLVRTPLRRVRGRSVVNTRSCPRVSRIWSNFARVVITGLSVQFRRSIRCHVLLAWPCPLWVVGCVMPDPRALVLLVAALTAAPFRLLPRSTGEWLEAGVEEDAAGDQLWEKSDTCEADRDATP